MRRIADIVQAPNLGSLDSSSLADYFYGRRSVFLIEDNGEVIVVPQCQEGERWVFGPEVPTSGPWGLNWEREAEMKWNTPWDGQVTKGGALTMDMLEQAIERMREGGRRR